VSLPARLPQEVIGLFAALALSPDAVFATDHRNHVIFWNKSAERMLGYAGDEVQRVSCAELLEGCDVHGNRYCSESCPVTQMARRTEVVRQFDLRLRAKDKRVVTVDVNILHLALEESDRFVLVHILKPQERTPVSSGQDAAGPPREQLIAVRSSTDARARRLTDREVEVLAMLAAGHATPEIASRLNISSVTARNHIQNILEKLDVHSKAEAVAFAFQKRLL